MELNKDTSYLIGLYQSDGHLCQGVNNKGKATIELSIKDEDIIYKIKQIIPYNYGIRKRTRNIIMKNKNYEYESINISVYNKEYREFLEKNGVPYGKKSKIIDVPKSKKLSNFDYIRGLFDGDGSLGFTKDNLPFVGFVTESEYIKDYLLDFISNITGKKRKVINRNKRDKIYNIVIYKEDAIIFCEKIYYDNCLSIDRKYRNSILIKKWVRPADMKKLDFERKKWMNDEDDYILLNTIEDSMNKLNRTKKSIQTRKYRLKNSLID